MNRPLKTKNPSKRKKTQTLFQIDSENEPASFEDVIRHLFFHSKAAAPQHLKILQYIRDHPDCTVKDWKKIAATVYDLKTQNEKDASFLKAKQKYFSALRRLKAAGLVYRKNFRLGLSDSFSEYLTQSARLNKAWKKQGESEGE